MHKADEKKEANVIKMWAPIFNIGIRDCNYVLKEKTENKGRESNQVMKQWETLNTRINNRKNETQKLGRGKERCKCNLLILKW
jgi:hypothetical protein